MLKKLLSKKNQKKVWIILAILILPPFIFWGSESLIQSMSSRSYAGVAFGKKITLPEFRDALVATENQLIMQLGEEFLKQKDEINLKARTWDRIILLAEARRRKIKIGDEEVRRFIQGNPLFSRKGKFDFVLYQNIIKSLFHLQPRSFEEENRENMMLGRLIEQITAKVNLTPQQIKETYFKDNEQISVDFLNASPKELESKMPLTQEEIKEFFQKNQKVFKQPASFNLEYIEIESNSLTNASELIRQQETLKKVYLNLKKGKDFAQIAKEFSLSLKETGFFNLKEPVPGIGWSVQIIEILEQLKPGQICPAIKTNKGWYVLRLKQKKEPYTPAFEKIENEVKEKLLKLKSKELARNNIQAALAKLKELYKTNPQEANFKNISKEFDLKAATTELFRRSSYISGIGYSDSFFNALVNLKDGQTSDIIELEQGFFIIKLKQRIGIDEEGFEKEKDDFTAQLLAKERLIRFTEFLSDLKRKARLKVLSDFAL